MNKQLVIPLYLGVLLFQTIPVLRAQTASEFYERGQEAFHQRKNEDAARYFSAAVALDSSKGQYYLYLGIAYQNDEQAEKAEDAYSRGLEISDSYADKLRFRRANLRWAKKDIEGASADYTVLIDNGGKLASAALLNRANLEVSSGMNSLALRDYPIYLVMEPDTPERENIEKIIDALKEEARKQKLLDEIRDSLNNSGEETTGITAGLEGVENESEDSELED